MLEDLQYRPRTPAEQAALLCEFVAGSPNAVMDFRIIAERADRKATVLEMQREGRPVRFNYRGKLPDLFPTLDTKNRAGWAVYYLTNRADGKGRRLVNMVAARMVALDLDGAPLPIPATAIRSEGDKRSTNSVAALLMAIAPPKRMFG